MLIRFTSTATESVTMFGDVAKVLIKMLGGSDRLPNAISAEDVAEVLVRLRQQLQLHAELDTVVGSKKNNDEDEKDREPPVALASRASPLIAIFERAAAAKAPVMWEKV